MHCLTFLVDKLTYSGPNSPLFQPWLKVIAKMSQKSDLLMPLGLMFCHPMTFIYIFVWLKCPKSCWVDCVYISIPNESSSSWYHYSISDHICVSFPFSALILKSLENIFKRGPKKTFTLFLNIMCSQCVYTTPCYGKNQYTLFVIFPMNQKQQLCPDSEAASFDCVIAAWWRLSQFPFPGQWRIQQIDPSHTQAQNS